MLHPTKDQTTCTFCAEYINTGNENALGRIRTRGPQLNSQIVIPLLFKPVTFQGSVKNTQPLRHTAPNINTGRLNMQLSHNIIVGRWPISVVYQPLIVWRSIMPFKLIKHLTAIQGTIFQHDLDDNKDNMNTYRNTLPLTAQGANNVSHNDYVCIYNSYISIYIYRNYKAYLVFKLLGHL